LPPCLDRVAGKGNQAQITADPLQT
jgi:hypothetical protein